MYICCAKQYLYLYHISLLHPSVPWLYSNSTLVTSPCIPLYPGCTRAGAARSNIITAPGNSMVMMMMMMMTMETMMVTTVVRLLFADITFL